MINVKVAKYAGYCFGVKNAIDKINELINNNIKLYCIGEIIHNDYAINKLKNKGLVIINDEKAILNLKNENVVIRTHGIEKEILEILKKNNNNVYDLTCPFVKKIHKIVDDNTKNGEIVILIGDKNHPEVKSIKSYANNQIYIINTVDEIDTINIDNSKQYLVISQTTSNANNYQKIIDILTKIFYNIKVCNTICKSTIERQKEADLLSRSCEEILVIGSKNSSNTKKLFDISSKNTKTYLVESKNDIDNIYLKSNVGILSGASTPLDLIEEISNYARSKF